MNKKLKTENLRCFVGIACPLSEPTQALFDVLEKLAKPEKLRLRISPPENLHITLKFVGNVETDQVGLLDSILRNQSAKQAPFNLRCCGLGFFDDSLHLSINQNDTLDQFVTNLNAAFTFLGYPIESMEFLPHITLARFKASAKAELLASPLRDYFDGEWGDLSVDSIRLYQSETLPEGAKYTAIESYPLTG